MSTKPTRAEIEGDGHASRTETPQPDKSALEKKDQQLKTCQAANRELSKRLYRMEKGIRKLLA